MSKKQIIGVLSVLIVVSVIVFISVTSEKVPEKKTTPLEESPEVVIDSVESIPVQRAIGTSVQGREILARTYGTGSTTLMFVGGIHGGYEWNSVLLSYELIDYLEANPESVPRNMKIIVIPSANPDGVYEVVGVEGRFALTDVPEKTKLGLGRFNAHSVDLNRNFNCKWKPESKWRGNTVSAGASPFSEPESQAIRDIVIEQQPEAVVFLHSQSNAVYASECESGILPETRTVMSLYAEASGYPAVDSFDAYEITGDAEGWLASINIPAITVELSTHETTEWARNLAGIKALFAHYGSE
ncbi:MAG: M14 family metallopeptidase [Candidatus Kaiserbacteria bacterium]|nr:M14 family metallopeptidase [Candidatus Kaiserbacteria bacterium]